MQKIICMHVDCNRIYLYCLFVVAEILKHVVENFLATVKVNLVLRPKINPLSTNKKETGQLSSKWFYGAQGNSLYKV